MGRERFISVTKRWLLVAALFLVMAFMLLPGRAYAATNEKKLSLSGNWVAATKPLDDVDLYYFSIPGDGWLNLKVTDFGVETGYTDGYDGNLIVEVLESDLSNSDDAYYYSEENENGGNSWPTESNPNANFKGRVPLTKGNYCVRIRGGSGDYQCGKEYQIRASFEAANNNEAEPNNSFDSAMSLTAGRKVTGFIAKADQMDFYRITVPYKTTVKFTAVSSVWFSTFTYYDSNHIEQLSDTIKYGNDESPKAYSKEVELAAGTYYLKFNGYYIDNKGAGYDGTGRYSLTWEYKSKSSASVSKTLKIRLKKSSYTYTGKKIHVKIKYVKAGNTTLTRSNYKVSYSNNKKVGIAKVTVTGRGSYAGYKGTATFKIVPRKMKVTKYGLTDGKRAVYLRWRKDSQATGYKFQFSANRSFRGARTYRVGRNTTKRTFRGLKKGRTYWFRIRAYKKTHGRTLYGPWLTLRIRTR